MRGFGCAGGGPPHHLQPRFLGRHARRLRHHAPDLRASSRLLNGIIRMVRRAALRTIAVSFDEKKELSDDLAPNTASNSTCVSFVDHLHYFSPYARLNYALPHGKIDFTWTSGNARPELGMTSADPNADLQRDLAALSAAPAGALSTTASECPARRRLRGRVFGEVRLARVPHCRL